MFGVIRQVGALSLSLTPNICHESRKTISFVACFSPFSSLSWTFHLNNNINNNNNANEWLLLFFISFYFISLLFRFRFLFVPIFLLSAIMFASSMIHIPHHALSLCAIYIYIFVVSYLSATRYMIHPIYVYKLLVI